MARPSTPTAVSAALKARFLADARRREQSIARFVSLLAGGCALIVLAVGGLIGWALTLTLSGGLALVAGYYAVLYRALRRGWFHPAILWVNAAIEVSTPAAIIAVDAVFQGPEYALTGPPLAIWGAAVMFSSLRHHARLPWMAGALAALEYVLVYALLIRPQMPAQPLVTLTAPFVLIRTALLFAFGPLTALISRYVMERVSAVLEELRANDLLGKYLLHERIGVGGMAEVFRATYSPAGGFEKPVAVKRVLPAYAEDAQFVALFRQEAALGSQLNHPNVVQVLDLVVRGDSLFLAMEFVDGAPLSSVLDAFAQRGVAFPIRAATYLAAEVAAGLEYVHTRADAHGAPLLLVHRDLNPPNILLSASGEVKISDFGIARASGRVVLTRKDQVRGKAAYMSPEQAAGERLDARTDLFALGLTLHEALTGARAIDGVSETAMMRMILERSVPPPSQLRSELPAELDAVVGGLLEREVSRRTSSAAHAREQLLRLRTEAAPYPHGKAELASAVRTALQWKADAKAAAGQTTQVHAPPNPLTAAAVPTVLTPRQPPASEDG